MTTVEQPPPPVDIVLDVPVPPSVNRTRRVNWAAMGDVNRWYAQADAALLASGQYRVAMRNAPTGAFTLQIFLDEKQTRIDLDNSVKAGIDYLRRIELIRGDDKRYLRGFEVTWGYAPAGCRLVLRVAE